MASKAEILNWIKEHAPLEELDNEVYKALVEWNDGRSQLVFVSFGDEVLEVSSPFAREDEITAQQAIQANMSFFGVDALAGMYCLKHVLPIMNVDENELIFALDLLAEAADEFEKKLGLGDKF